MISLFVFQSSSLQKFPVRSRLANSGMTSGHIIPLGPARKNGYRIGSQVNLLGQF